jgi:hypothetical protein
MVFDCLIIHLCVTCYHLKQHVRVCFSFPILTDNVRDLYLYFLE